MRLPMSNESGQGPSQSDFLKTASDFVTGVQKSLQSDDPVFKVLWGVEVLLLITLVFMVSFGGITADQRFYLALFIIFLMALVLVLIAWRAQGQRTLAASPASADLLGQARKCLALLVEIQDANARIIRLGRGGTPPWVRILTDTYGRVCQTCYRRRLGTEPPDAYFDVICAEPDVDTVCKRKWELGETLDVYRSRINGASAKPLDHDDLELLIRRSVTQPDWSPPELDAALRQAIVAAKRVLPSS
jgi:hypothetical protein